MMCLSPQAPLSVGVGVCVYARAIQGTQVEGLHLSPGVSGKFPAQGDCALLPLLVEGIE